MDEQAANDRAALLALFQKFTSFGDKTNKTLLDNAKFFKLCKDTGLIDKHLNRTEVDMIFVKTCPKGQRKLDFEGFLRSLDMVATRKFPNLGFDDAIDNLYEKLIHAGAPSSSSTVQADPNASVTDRLTDTSKYTGAHKHRFDESGQGRGMEGRDSLSKGRGTRSGQINDVEVGVGNMSLEQGRSKSSSGPLHSSSHHLSMEGTVQGFDPASAKKKPSRKASDITARLTDSSQYTGAHKHRFDSSGQGRGAAGRDNVGKGSGTSSGSIQGRAAGSSGYVSGYRNANTYK